MKLRIRGNSIRLRLLKSEVERFAAEGMIADETSFGANAFRYALAMSPDAEKVYAEFEDGEVCVFIPESLARDWVINDQVGVEAEQAIGDEQLLSILVEKDFACLDRPNDPDRDDAFPNPNASC